VIKHIKWIALAAGLLVLGGGVGRAIVNKKAQQAELAQSAATAQSGVVLLGDKEVHTVSPVLLTHAIPVSGSLTAQRSALVKAKVAAELLSLAVREGDQVKADQVIGRLDPQEFETRLMQARQQAASAKAQWQIAQQNRDNNEALIKQGFISKALLDSSQSSEAAARATFEAAQAAVELASKSLQDSIVRAPISGRVSQRFAQAGERVGVDGRIVEIVDLDSLELQAPLSPQDVTQVRVGAPATLRVDGLPEDLPARIVRINPSATADTRSVLVYLALQPHPALRQGLFAQGAITLNEQKTLSVPQGAITRESGRDQVLRVADGKVARVDVKLGTHSGTGPDGQAMQEIAQGLSAGDIVLRNAAGTVHEGQAVKLAAGQGHAASAAN
jgi:RND family efflux transporter MFP subunit